MKLAILSESPADEAAIQVLVRDVLKQPFTVVQAALRARGWPSVEQVLPAIVRHLHFKTEKAVAALRLGGIQGLVSPHDHAFSVGAVVGHTGGNAA